MQSYFNPETQRVKSLWQTYHALFAAAQQQQSAFLRCLAFAALSATLFGVAIGLLYPLLLALEQTEAGQSAVIFWSVLCGVLFIASLLFRIWAEYYDTKGDSLILWMATALSSPARNPLRTARDTRRSFSPN